MSTDLERTLQTEIERINTALLQDNAKLALQLSDKLLEQHPDFPIAWHLKGITLKKEGLIDQSITHFNHALNLQPDFKEACLSLGRTLEESGQTLMAIKAFEHWLNIEQSTAPATLHPPALTPAAAKAVEQHFQAGLAFQKQNTFGASADAFKEVLAICPDMPEALINLGFAYHYLGQGAEAQKVLLQSLRLKPHHMSTLNLLGDSYAMSGDTVRAVAAWNQVVARSTQHFTATVSLAKAFTHLHLQQQAIEMCERALRIQPQNNEVMMHLLHLLRSVCRWEKIELVEEKIRKQVERGGQPMEPCFTSWYMPDLQTLNIQRYNAANHPDASGYSLARTLPSASRKEGKLRIAYMTDYSAAREELLRELCKRHDRQSFEIFIFTYGAAHFSWSGIKKSADHFQQIGHMPDSDAGRAIEQHGIDILVDLKGHETGLRIGILALRPASLQISLPFYSTAPDASYIDYVITDNAISPHANDHALGQCMIHLPHVYAQNHESVSFQSPASSRHALGLPENVLVYGALNNSNHITPEMFAAWLNVLRQTENSVLWLQETYAEATTNLRNQAQKGGIAPERIITTTSRTIEMLTACNIMLDTSPICGWEIAKEALHAGIPVVTLSGKHMASRTTTSLLNAAQLPDLIAANLDQYQAIAVALAHDKERRVVIKNHLQKKHDLPLWDAESLVDALEKAYRTAAQKHAEGKPPQEFTIEK